MLVTLGATAPARAAAVTRTGAPDDRRVVVTASPGEANRITLAGSSSGGINFPSVTIDDAGSVLTSSASDCIVETPHRVVCDLAATIDVSAGDGDDQIDASGLQTAPPSSFFYNQHLRADGGPGADIITGGPNDDAIDGGEGNDLLLGGPGGDTIGARDRLRLTTAGADVVDGQEGSRSEPDVVYAGDGGEPDRLRGTVLVYRGAGSFGAVDLTARTTSNDDTLAGFEQVRSDGPVPLTATASGATLVGGPAGDGLSVTDGTIDGGQGDDLLSARGGSTIRDRDRGPDRFFCPLGPAGRTVAVETWPQAPGPQVPLIPRECRLVRDRPRRLPIQDIRFTRTIEVDPAIRLLPTGFRVNVHEERIESLDEPGGLEDEADRRTDPRPRRVRVTLVDDGTGRVLARGAAAVEEDWRRTTIRPTRAGRAVIATGGLVRVRVDQLRFRTYAQPVASGRR